MRREDRLIEVQQFNKASELLSIRGYPIGLAEAKKKEASSWKSKVQ